MKGGVVMIEQTKLDEGTGTWLARVKKRRVGRWTYGSSKRSSAQALAAAHNRYAMRDELKDLRSWSSPDREGTSPSS